MVIVLDKLLAYSRPNATKARHASCCRRICPWSVNVTSGEATSESSMPESDGTPSCEESDLADLAGEIMHAAPHNVVFQVRFLGESQLKLQSHFRRFIEKELGERGADREKYPLLQYFIDAHSAELRDFVFTGVSLECSVRIDDMERMTGESAGMLRVDLWDSLISHIGSAQRKFRNEAGDMHQQLQTLEAEIAAGRMDRQ